MTDILLHDDYFEAVAFLLDENVQDVQRELAPDSLLVGLEFIEARTDNVGKSKGFPRKQDDYFIPHTDVVTLINQQYDDPKDIIRLFMGDPTNGPLTISENFAYMEQTADDMVATVEGFLDESHSGFKILTLAGEPGVGKTEVTGAVKKAVSKRLNEDIPFLINGDFRKPGDVGTLLKEPTREERWKRLFRRAYMAHKMGLKCVLVEDDCEEMLKDLNRPDIKEQGSKDFVNRMLKRLGYEFGIPVVFITNRPDMFDPATTRTSITNLLY